MDVIIASNLSSSPVLRLVEVMAVLFKFERISVGKLHSGSFLLSLVFLEAILVFVDRHC